MRILLYRLTKSDPTTFVGTFGMWSLICGIALLLPGNVFDYSPAWNALQVIHADDSAWGWAMVADGLLLIASIRMAKVPQRAAISAFSAVMWSLLGVSMVVDGYKAGFVSIIGGYSIWGSICCVVAVEQWVRYPLGGDPNGVR